LALAASDERKVAKGKTKQKQKKNEANPQEIFGWSFVVVGVAVGGNLGKGRRREKEGGRERETCKSGLINLLRYCK